MATGNMRTVTVHSSVTMDRVVGLLEDQFSRLDDPGVCLFCGAESEGVEPDARGYKCDACREFCVVGLEECVAMGAFSGCTVRLEIRG